MQDRPSFNALHVKWVWWGVTWRCVSPVLCCAVPPLCCAVQDLISRLLERKPVKRAGMLQGRAGDIKRHPWFKVRRRRRGLGVWGGGTHSLFSLGAAWTGMRLLLDASHEPPCSTLAACTVGLARRHGCTRVRLRPPVCALACLLM